MQRTPKKNDSSVMSSSPSIDPPALGARSNRTVIGLMILVAEPTEVEDRCCVYPLVQPSCPSSAVGKAASRAAYAAKRGSGKYGIVTPGYPSKAAENRTSEHSTWFHMHPRRAAGQSGAQRKCQGTQKGPPMAGFFELVIGLRAPKLAAMGAKSPIVFGRYLKYSRFRETAVGDRVR